MSEQQESKLCEPCARKGLAILPVRYAPVPDSVRKALPAWASGEGVAEHRLSHGFHYALRAIRPGFLYVFYKKNARGANRWENHAVSEHGIILPLPAPQTDMSFALAFAPAACRTEGHNNMRLHHFVIDAPAECETVWIAFSEHRWTQKTLDRYKNSESLRDARMQKIEPKELVASAEPKAPHLSAEPATALNDVLDYADDFSQDQLPYDQDAPVFSQRATGAYNSSVLYRMGTRYPWRNSGNFDVPEAARMLGERGATADGEQHPGVVMALWDPLAAVHELNGFRNDVVGWASAYADERELELSAYNAINGVKQALQNRVLAQIDQHQREIESTPMANQRVAVGVVDSAHRGARDRSALLSGYWDLFDQHQAGTIDDATFRNRRNVLVDRHAKSPQDAARMKGEIDAAERAGRQDADARQDVFDERRRREPATAWTKYEERLKEGSYHAFEENYKKLLAEIGAMASDRTPQLIRWLEAPHFLAVLEDYDDEDVGDGLAFEDAVSEAIFGISSSDNGAAKIDEWVRQARATERGNLVWRTLALNQKEAKAEVDQALQAARDTVITPGDSALAGLFIKQLQRMVDIYKKAVSLLSTNTGASAAAGSRAFSVKLAPINTRGVDKFAVTVGDSVFRHFKVDQVGVFTSEKMVQHLFSIRAFVSAEDSFKLVMAQASEQTQANRQRLQSFRQMGEVVDSFKPENSTARAAQLQGAWNSFRAGSGGPAALKDARLALVVGLIEGANLSKMLALDVAMHGRRDSRIIAQVGLSATLLTATVIDIASIPVKAVFGAESRSFQRLKLWGGGLAGFASLAASSFDFIDGAKEYGQGRYGIGVLYFTKGGLGVVSGLAAWATAYTYAAPLIQRMMGTASTGAVGRLSARAAAVVAARILLMSVGAWLTVATLVIQGLIWWFTDNELEKWCDGCALGKQPNPAWMRTPDAQMQALDNAIKEVM